MVEGRDVGQLQVRPRDDAVVGRPPPALWNRKDLRACATGSHDRVGVVLAVMGLDGDFYRARQNAAAFGRCMPRFRS